jgi:endonuclease YncB( thermonuclease family)
LEAFLCFEKAPKLHITGILPFFLVTAQPRVDMRSLSSKENNASLEAKCGILNAYQIIHESFSHHPGTKREIFPGVLSEDKGALVIDLGFSCYLRLPEKYAKLFKAGDIVAPQAEKVGYTLKFSRAKVEDLFTYRASILEVVDGDTLWTLVDLGFGITTKQCLRLRGIDCPEMKTPEGIVAKEYAQSILPPSNEVVIASTKSDKYDRYLADVWAGKVSLNQSLLDSGHAVRAY